MESNQNHDIALRNYVRTVLESSIDTIARRYQTHPIAVASSSSVQTTNAQSHSSLENRAVDTKSHTLLEPQSPQWLDHDENWHCQ